jgi:flagellar hook-associated protein 3 FlgL
MRMSTVQIFQQGVNNLLDRQADVTKTQEQLASGTRILDAGEDPAGTVRILNITSDLARVDAYQRNTDNLRGQLAMEESALTSVVNDLQRVRELTVQGNNATMSAADRQMIATEMSGILDSLVDRANTRDATGEFIFAGFQANDQPFARTTAGVTYSGDDGQRFLQVAADGQIASRDSGEAVFMSARAGNGDFDYRAAAGNAGTAVVSATSASSSYVPETYTLAFIQANPTDPVTYTVTGNVSGQVATGTYTEGNAITFAGGEVRIEGTPANGDSFTITSTARQDLFTTVKDIMDAFNGATGTTANDARINNEASRGLANLDNAIENILKIQSDVGTRMRRADQQTETNEAFNLQLKETLSELKDLDYAEAISRLNIQMLALQAAQQTFAKTQQMSLFNYL